MVAVVCSSLLATAGCGPATIFYHGQSRHKIEVEGQARRMLLRILAREPDTDNPGAEAAFDSGRYLWMEDERYDVDYFGNAILISDSYGFRMWRAPELPAVINELEEVAERHLRRGITDDVAADFGRSLSQMSAKELIMVLGGWKPGVSAETYYACKGYDLIEAELSRRGRQARSVLVDYSDSDGFVMAGAVPRRTIGEVCRRLLRQLPAEREAAQPSDGSGRGR